VMRRNCVSTLAA